jgi:hypothetical protein
VSFIRSSTTSSRLVGAAALGLVVAAAAVGYQRGRASQTAEAQRAELAREVALLTARIQAVERRARVPALAPRPAVERAAEATTSPPPVQAPAARPVRPPPADEEDTRRYFLAVEGRLAAQARDPSWAEPTEQRLRHAGDGLPVTVASVRCGRDLCRLELQRDPGPQAPSTLEELVRRAVTVLPTALVQNTDDPARVVVYLARDAGQGFPPLVGRASAP